MGINIPLMILGIVFIAFGAFLLINQIKSQKKCKAPATAEVVQYFESISHDSESDAETVSYFPIMRYYAFGQYYEQKSDIGSGKQKYGIGEKVKILYNSDNPREFIIEGDNSTFVVSAISIVIGIGIIILSFFVK